MRKVMEAALSIVARQVNRLGYDPDDTEELRLQKSIGVSAALFGILIECLLGLICLFSGEPVAGWFVLGAALFLLVGLVGVGLFPRHYYAISVTWIADALLTSFVMSLLLGGFRNSAFLNIWAFFCPLIALMIHRPSRAGAWFLAALALTVLTAALQPYLRQTNNLSDTELALRFLVNAIGAGLLTLLPVYYFVRQRDAALQQLRLEQEKSENLLLNILPREVARALKDDSRVIANHFEGASVLFADIVGFTPLSSQMAAAEVVELLNEIFTHFDALVEKHHLEKIKTIGDCYMVASGVPTPRHDHAARLVRLALDLQTYVEGRVFAGRWRVGFRIGINSGPVVAGVIGRKKFIYDLWGDAVNTASRMESHSRKGAIQVSRATYDLIKEEFLCEPQGVINIKGKGEMEVWHVVRERTVPEATADRLGRPQSAESRTG
jgi:guanylate cyclase